MPPRRRAGCFLAAMALTFACNIALAIRPAAYVRDFAQARAIIETSRNVCLVLELYLAETPEQHRQGLMFIERMDAREGMLFRYARAATLSMWMKNTRISLDMLFIRADGSVAGIERRTKPMTTTRITSPEPVPFVLELNGGGAELWGIEPGNRLLTVN